jgi:hypothetical protein
MSHLDPFNPMPRPEDINRGPVHRPQGKAALGWAVGLLLLLVVIALIGVAAG